jgi:DNA segregation ATPase FtsK/SpoIIIE-like protein
MPSLDRMKKKIADLETEAPRDEAAGERLYDLALETVFRSRKASPGLLREELDLDARTAARLLQRMEDEGVVGPRRDRRGERKLLISRRKFEELRSTGRR